MATRLTGTLTVAYRATAGAALAMLSMLLLSGIAQAQGGPVWRCVDGSGRPQYTNVQADTTGKQCTAVTKEVSVVRPPAGNSPPPQSAAVPAGRVPPNVSAGTQRARDDSRRKILQKELADEEAALASAKADFAEQEGQRSGNERNYQRVLDRLAPYQDKIDQHTKNIEALQNELGSLR